VALRAELASEGQVVFVPGVGQLADRATVSGGALLVGTEPHPIAIMSAAGPLTVDATPEEAVLPVQPMHLVATSPVGAATADRLADLRIVVGESTMTVWRSLAELAGVPTAQVRGHVTGTDQHALVFGRDAQGNPQVRARAGDGGVFALDVLATKVRRPPNRAPQVVAI